ncbi:hypothetical protein TeGR_g12073 [Tetraparma gracilis]|uniref:NADPH--hemoprotein reductase n=1 Tax=Tetraparma gracilis TaxID=2962635 RepID=A0ABQ6NEL0_9STRA|nr:hypothetical protein TeGR_g12073 [Tetraparma gracilis]
MDSPAVLAGAGVVLLGVSYALYSMSSSSSASSPSAPAAKSTSSAAAPAKSTNGVINVYFGSQTGTAEGFADQIRAEDHGYDVKVHDLEDFDADSASEHAAGMKAAKLNLFLLATYGEGEPTDNAAEFVRLLKAGELDVAGAPFAVFGLGNTQYEHYNAMGKLADGKLEKAGAERKVPMGMGDDDKSMEEDWEAWKEKLWSAFSTGSAKASKGPGKIKPTFDYKEAPAGSKPKSVPADKRQPSTRFYFEAVECECKVNKELRSPTDGGSTKHIEVSLPPSLKYNTADNSAVLPRNDAALVKSLAASLDLDLSKTFELAPHDGKHMFPTPCTVSDLLTKYTDITGPLRRADLKALSAYCSDPLDSAVLLRLASKEGKAEYLEKIEKPQVNFHHLATSMVKSLSLTVPDFVAVTSRLQPRYYTISSSSTKHPTALHMTVSVIEGKNALTGRPFAGVCSKHLQEATKCDVFVKESTFKLPEDNKTPVVMIGPGTGIAPMRALLQEVRAQASGAGGKGGGVR